MTKFDGRKMTPLSKADHELAPKSVCRSILRDRRGVLWFGTHGGLYRYDGHTWTWLNSRDCLPGDMVNDIAESPDGAIWLSTAATGLVRYRQRTVQPNAPIIKLQSDREYTDLAHLPPIVQGTRHKLVTATNGLEALKLVEEHLPDVILMDMRMPELDGYGATQQLKANPALKHIPVIAVTASSFREQEDRARKVCDGFIRKPFNRAELIAELKRFLRQAELRDKPSNIAPAGTPVSTTEDFVPATSLAKWPGMIVLLRAEEAGVWPELCQTLELGPLEEFATRLRNLGEAHGAAALSRYGKELLEQAQQFDLDRLPKSLETFPRLIEQLAKRI